VFLAGAAESDDGAAATAAAREPVADTTPVLQAIELAVAFGGNRAVNGATFEVGQREIVGVIGPNGAGKTTVFDLISGFVPLDGGRVVLNGNDIGELPASARAGAGLGRSFQDARLFPDMTVSETLAVSLERWVSNRSALAAAIRWPAVFDDEERTALRVDELIELMHLGDYRNAFVRELSTGTRRVVDLACIAAHRPVMVLLDEPSSGIAQREVEALAPVLRRLRDEMGASLLVIEHDIPLVSSISDRLVALDQGAVLTSGRPSDVLTHPDVIESYLGNNTAAHSRSGNRG
jgi:ABC-type branched-subunit amino acid transport system ATPase component